jgi:hypothetical protein
MARWPRHRRRLRRKIRSTTTIIAQSALRSFWSRPRSRRSHLCCQCRLVSNGSSILLTTHRCWPSRRAWLSDRALRPPPDCGQADLRRRGAFSFIAGVIRQEQTLHLSSSGDLPTTARPFPAPAACADFAALESRSNFGWELSLASRDIGVTAMVDWVILTGVIVIAVAMYFLERG